MERDQFRFLAFFFELVLFYLIRLDLICISVYIFETYAHTCIRFVHKNKKSEKLK